MKGYDDMDREENPDEDCVQAILPINPIQEKDAKIAALEKQIDELKVEVSDVSALRENLTKTFAELKLLKADSRSTQRRLSFARNVTEQRMVEQITDGSELKDPHLASLYSATLNEDEFEFDEDTNAVKPVSEGFLKKVEVHCDLTDKQQEEKLNTIKNQILEKVKVTKSRRDMSRSTNSNSSKRGADQSLERNSLARIRVKSPMKK